MTCIINQLNISIQLSEIRVENNFKFKCKSMDFRQKQVILNKLYYFDNKHYVVLTKINGFPKFKMLI